MKISTSMPSSHYRDIAYWFGKHYVHDYWAVFRDKNSTDIISILDRESLDNISKMPNYIGLISRSHYDRENREKHSFKGRFFSFPEKTNYHIGSFSSLQKATIAILKKKKEIQNIISSPEKHLERELSNHDWHYMYSDDYGTYRSGHAHMEKIKLLLQQVSQKKGQALWNTYAPPSLRESNRCLEK